MHEAVEDELVHPYVSRRVAGAKQAVAERVEEEREVNNMLVALDALGPMNPGVEEVFSRFRGALFAHADKEESSEFAGIRSPPAPRSDRPWRPPSASRRRLLRRTRTPETSPPPAHSSSERPWR